MNDVAFVYNAYYELESSKRKSSIAEETFKKVSKIISPERAFRGYLDCQATNSGAVAADRNVDINIETKLLLTIATTRHVDESIR